MKPRIFVGSAQEHIQLLENLQRKNEHSPFRYYPWTNLDVFPQGSYPLPSLIDCLKKTQGAVFLAFGEDVTWWRNNSVKEPRDNVIFELGLAIGLLGVDQVFIATDHDSKLPSDFSGYKTQTIRFSGDPSADADDLHVHIKDFFQRSLTSCSLSANKPDRFPEVTWERLSYSFPEFDDRQVQRAIALLKQNRFSEAISAVKDKTDIATVYIRCRTALLCGDFSETKKASIELLNKGIELVEQGKHDAYWFVEIAARRIIKLFGDFDLIRDALNRVAKSYQPPDLNHMRGHIELQSKNYEKAIRYYDNSIADGSIHAWTHLDRAECYYRLGQEGQLLDALRTVERIWPEHLHSAMLFHYLDAPNPVCSKNA